MSGGTPRPDPLGKKPAITPPKPADYSDELTNEQIEALKSYAPQDESQMGELVYEFRWGDKP